MEIIKEVTQLQMVSSSRLSSLMTAELMRKWWIQTDQKLQCLQHVCISQSHCCGSSHMLYLHSENGMCEDSQGRISIAHSDCCCILNGCIDSISWRLDLASWMNTHTHACIHTHWHTVYSEQGLEVEALCSMSASVHSDKINVTNKKHEKF